MIRLIRGARRRFFYNELLGWETHAMSALLSVQILLLLAGAEAIDWRWLVLFPTLLGIAGLCLALKRRPSDYATAQIVDRRLALADTLSTAVYFGAGGSGIPPGVRECQRVHAERLAESVDVRRAVPFAVPRGIYVLAVLLLTASSLFALRYRLAGRLDPRPSLARILRQNFEPKQAPELSRAARPDLPKPSDSEAEAGAVSADPQTPENAEASTATPPDRQSAQPAPAESSRPGARTGEARGDDAEPEAEERSGDRNAGNQPADGQADPNRPAASRRERNGSSETPSLLARVNGAVQNLLSRLKSQPASSNPAGKQGDGSRKGDQQQQAGGNVGKPTGEQAGNPPDGPADASAGNSPDPQGKAAGRKDTQQTGKQAGSGIGSQDGSKALRQAEQLAAMGKISEILGKRSATITGQASVEAQASTQQLRTPYAERRAQHVEGGAEIRRDEVPVALQTYVAQYLEQVRKHSPTYSHRK